VFTLFLIHLYAGLSIRQSMAERAPYGNTLAGRKGYVPGAVVIVFGIFLGFLTYLNAATGCGTMSCPIPFGPDPWISIGVIALGALWILFVFLDRRLSPSMTGRRS
jgi:hypothetical protein